MTELPPLGASLELAIIALANSQNRIIEVHLAHQKMVDLFGRTIMDAAAKSVFAACPELVAIELGEVESEYDDQGGYYKTLPGLDPYGVMFFDNNGVVTSFLDNNDEERNDLAMACRERIADCATVIGVEAPWGSPELPTSYTRPTDVTATKG